MFVKLAVILAILSVSTVAFQLAPKGLNLNEIRPPFHRLAPLQMAAKPTTVVASPNVFKQLIGASSKNKLIVGAHAIAVVAILWLLKWIIISIQATFFSKKEITAKKGAGPRYYGISRPIRYVPPAQQQSTPKPRVTVASVVSTTTTSSSTSILRAKAQVISILESLDQATLKAKEQVEIKFKTFYQPKISTVSDTPVASYSNPIQEPVKIAVQPKRFYGISRPVRFKQGQTPFKTFYTQTTQLSHHNLPSSTTHILAEEDNRIAQMKLLEQKRREDEASMVQTITLITPLAQEVEPLQKVDPLIPTYLPTYLFGTSGHTE